MVHMGTPRQSKLLAAAFLALVGLCLSAPGAEANCRNSNGLTYRNGEEWEERGAFIMRCTVYDNGSWKTEVIACVMPGGTGRRIPINQSAINGNDEWKCQMNAGGMVTLIQVGWRGCTKVIFLKLLKPETYSQSESYSRDKLF